MKKIVIIVFFLIFLVIVSWPKQACLIGMIVGGSIISPEGSAVLRHYCFGNGDTLELDADYIKSSPVFLKNAKKLKVGESKRVVFKQSEDWRLSYALNPFVITRTSTGYLIHQYIKFDSSGKIYTDLNLFFTKIRVSDNFVHAFECKPFVAICKI